MQLPNVQIDLSETFMHLSKAPVVEAVIDLGAPVNTEWEGDRVTETLIQALPDYPELENHEEIKHEVKFHVGKVPEVGMSPARWLGARLKTDKKDFIAQFTRTGFTLSHLHPYSSREKFWAEFLRLWEINRAVAKPALIQRVGVRFINRIPLRPSSSLSDYLKAPPAAPPGFALQLVGFIHKEHWAVPDRPYVVTLGRTIQPGRGNELSSLILDIDVISHGPIDIDRRDLLNSCLAELWWVKNKVFFAVLTDDVVKFFV